MQKYKYEIWLLKSTILDPELKQKKNMKTIFFTVFISKLKIALYIWGVNHFLNFFFSFIF